MLPEDDSMIETCSSVFNVNFRFIKDYICAFVGVLLKYISKMKFLSMHGLTSIPSKILAMFVFDCTLG